MGKAEVFEFLVRLRLCGNDDFLRYGEVHEEMRREGQSYSYTSVWRCLNGLYSDEMLEVEFDRNGLQRTAKFRAKLSRRMQVSHMKRVHNILSEQEERTPSARPRGQSGATAKPSGG